MNNQEARFILGAYRPGGQDATDPQFREALEQAQHDPTLKRWLEQQTAVDAQMAQALEKVTPPADLKANILLGAKLSQQRQQWQFIRPLAAAAIVLLVAIGAISPFVHLHRPKNLMSWQAVSLTTINNLVESKDHFNFAAAKPKDITQWLHVTDSTAAPKMPPHLNELRSLGCKVLNEDGHCITIVCFHLTPTELVHLVTYDTPTPSLNKPRFMEHNGWHTATWTADGKTYMLATKAEQQKLEQLLL
ncbi:MAG: DUF3379 family protein [Chthoniobacteraceae bacterium]